MTSIRTRMLTLALGAAIVAVPACSSDRGTASEADRGPRQPITVVPATGLELPGYTPPTLNLPGVEVEMDLTTCSLTVVATEGTLGFKRNSAELPTDPRSLDALTSMIDEFATATVVHVVGHSSYSDGSDDYNRELSRRRAVTVANFAASRMPKVDFIPDGVGGTSPLKTEDGSEDSRSPNRRVELSGEIEREECDG